jgi:hypothetical protein
MMTLPATLQEAQALSFAREWFANLNTDDPLGLGVPLLHHDAGHLWLRRIMMLANSDDAAGAQMQLELVCRARAGYDDAHLALVAMITERTNRHEPLPALLAGYNIELINGRTVRRPPGRQLADNLLQDIAVVGCMMGLMRLFGLKPTRYKYSRLRPSAASVTARAMTEAGLHRGTEGAVEKIWQRLKGHALPGYIGLEAYW